MHIHQHDFRFGLLQQTIRRAKRAIVMNHEYPALQVDHGVRHPAAGNAFVVPTAGSSRRIIRRTQHPTRVASVRHSRGEIVVDLFLVPNVIAGSEDIGAQIEELFANRGRNAESTRRILHINDQEFDLVGFDQVMEVIANDLAPRTAEDVTDEENLHLSG